MTYKWEIKQSYWLKRQKHKSALIQASKTNSSEDQSEAQNIDMYYFSYTKTKPFVQLFSGDALNVSKVTI